MIKLKKLLFEAEPRDSDDLNIAGKSESTKTINDEFQVNDWMLQDIQKTLEKVNKKLKSRNLPELELEILKSEWIESLKRKKNALNDRDPIPMRIFVHTIKVEGDIPQIKDYEFIAKIEHGVDGNIINMAPNRSIEKLPDEYKTFNQKCDICGTNRERNNTFIIRKIDEDKLITAGSSCLKKFMPLEDVKKMMDYAIQLNDMRGILAKADGNWDFGGEGDDDYYGGGRGGGRWRESYEPETILLYCVIAYLDNFKQYVSGQKAQEFGKSSTLGDALHLKYSLESPVRTKADRQERMEAQATVNKHLVEAKKLTQDILDWSKTYDFDKAAQESPKMDAYFNNLKVLTKRDVLERQHIGYFASLISLYAREMQIKNVRPEKKQSEYYGNIGDKIKDIKVNVKFVTSFDTAFGTMVIYSMVDDDGHVFVYKGQYLNITGTGGGAIGITKGDDILLSGTIKSHQDYKGTKQTIVQRPKVKAIAT